VRSGSVQLTVSSAGVPEPVRGKLKAAAGLQK
jgi:hypothetical protein